MGADIHVHVEKKIDGVWVTADTWYPDDDDPNQKSLYKWGEGSTKLAGPIYTSRNYDLFAILANVRNGSGFAGVDTGDGFIPLEGSPRGLPDDVSPEVEECSTHWGADGHSHSYCTLQELLEYDWTRTTKKRGWVSVKEFLRFKLHGKPEEWCGGVTGNGVIHLNNEEMEAHIITELGPIQWATFHKAPDRSFDGAFTQIEWEVPYYEPASEFLSETIPKLLHMAPDKNFNNIRLVFWFDN